MKATDTAILGHLGTNDTLYLSAVASADLWTSSTGVFIQGRVLGTFVGQAIGAGNRDMAGVWLQAKRIIRREKQFLALKGYGSFTFTADEWLHYFLCLLLHIELCMLCILP